MGQAAEVVWLEGEVQEPHAVGSSVFPPLNSQPY